MQPYQTYSMNNMYQQPMYQPMQNPYMDNRIAQLQAMQQNLQTPQMSQSNFGISGRIVDDFNNITANDVPMDNFGAIFVKADGTELQRRIWDKNGRIVTTRFKAVSDDFEGQTANLSSKEERPATEILNKAIEGLYKKVDDLSLRLDEVLKTKVSSKSKKDVETE